MDHRDGQSRPGVIVHVCTTCRPAGEPPASEGRPGARLYHALAAALKAAGIANVTIEPVECLSVCKRPCTVAVSSAGRWTYVYGDLDPETAAETVLRGVALYAETPDGIVPWRERPEAFRKGVVARIPPVAPVKQAAE